jgi:hypothetical protein
MGKPSFAMKCTFVYLRREIILDRCASPKVTLKLFFEGWLYVIGKPLG